MSRVDDPTEAITLALHDDSPQHLVDAMTDDVVLELGWGTAAFRADLRRPRKLAAVLAAERPGRRDICIYARESHVLIARAPDELFIDPSHTYRLRFGADDTLRADAPPGSRCAGCGHPPTPTRSTGSTCAAGWCPRPPRSSGTTTGTSTPSTTWSPCVRMTAKVPSSAPSPASTTTGCSAIPRAARACGRWRSIRRPACPASVPH